MEFTHSNPLTPQIPQILGRYRLVRKLGQGGVGQVYEAEHVYLGRRCALKILHQGGRAPAALADRFRKEILALSHVSHRNVVHATDAGCAGSTLFLIMPLLDGRNLQKLANSGPLSPEFTADLILQTATGLVYLESLRLVHRDIKPSNLQLTSSGLLKILDLGLAQFREKIASYLEPGTPGLILGTPEYMAPEQADASGKVDSRADVYSLGCTWYTLLSRRVPYPAAQTTLEKIFAHQHLPFPELQRTDIPEAMRQLLARMTAKSPKDRPRPAELLYELQLAGCRSTVNDEFPTSIQPEPDLEPKESVKSPNRRQAILALTGLIAGPAVMLAGTMPRTIPVKPRSIGLPDLTQTPPLERVNLLESATGFPGQSISLKMQHNGSLQVTTQRPQLLLLGMSLPHGFTFDLSVSRSDSFRILLVFGCSETDSDPTTKVLVIRSTSEGNVSIRSETLETILQPILECPATSDERATLRVYARRWQLRRTQYSTENRTIDVPPFELQDHRVPSGGLALVVPAGTNTIYSSFWIRNA